MNGSSPQHLPALAPSQSSERLEDRIEVTRGEIEWVKREMDSVRDRIHFSSGAQWTYALRRRGHEESMATHAGKTLAFVGIVEAVKKRQGKALKKLAAEKRRLEDRMEDERRQLKEAREHERRHEMEAEADREKRERRNSRRRGRYAERKTGRDRGGDRGAERDPA